MTHRLIAACTLSLVVLSTAGADILSIDVTQTGGFYDSGLGPDNDFSKQNYFVGYGTTPGFDRTPERRSFFWFDLSGVHGEIHGAKLELALPFGGVVFGKGAGDIDDPEPPDAVEEFQLGAIPTFGEEITMPGMSEATAAGHFASFDDTKVADPFKFTVDGPPPGVLDIHLSDLGVMFLNIRAGSQIVLTGWMPTWSHDDRLAPPSSPVEYFEASELLFGLTDVHSGAVAKPKLVLDYTPTAVPEPSGLAFLALGGAALIRLRRRR